MRSRRVGGEDGRGIEEWARKRIGEVDREEWQG